MASVPVSPSELNRARTGVDCQRTQSELGVNVTDRAFYISGAAVLALAVCLHLFFFSRGFYSIGWDESGRTLDAHTWAAHGTVLAKAWLPFYRICVGLGLRAFPDLVLTPRIISFLYGLASILAAAWLAHELFQSRKTTLLTLTLSTFFSQRVALSLAPLSDIMFIFVILATMALFSRWLRTYSRNALLLCALFGALATTLRYEGWIFGAAIFLIVAGCYFFASAGMERKDLLLSGLILFSFPLGWALSTFFTTNPIDVVIADAQQYSPRQILRKNPLIVFVRTNGFTLNFIGGVAILQFIRGGEWRYKAIVTASFGPLVVASLVLLLTQSAQTGPSWRMIGVWSMLLLPFTACVLAGCSWPSAGGKIRNVLAAGATVLVLGAFVYDAFRIERNSSRAFPESDRLAGQYLNELITANPDTKILIESSRYFFLNIQIASQHPDAFVRNSVPELKCVPILPLGGPVRAALVSQRIEFLVFQTDEYKDFLNQSPDVTKVKDFGPWSIYELMQTARRAPGARAAIGAAVRTTPRSSSPPAPTSPAARSGPDRGP